MMHVEDRVPAVDLAKSDLLEDVRHRPRVVEGAEAAVVDRRSGTDEAVAELNWILASHARQ